MKTRSALRNGISAAKSALINSPFALITEVTGKCNLRCQMCSVWKTFDFEDAPASEFIKTINFFEGQGARILFLTGGEPLLRNDLKTILEEVNTFNLINTNGFFLPEKLASISDNTDFLFVSLDSPIAREHDSIRGVKGTFERAVAGIKEARSIGIPVNIVMTIMESNFGRVEQMCELSKELDCLLSTNYLINLNKDYHEKQVYFNNESKSASLEKYVKTIQSLRKKHRHLIATDFELNLLKNGGNHIETPLCKAGETVIGIKPNCSIALPCTHYPLKYVNTDEWKKEKFKGGGSFKFCEGCSIKCFVNLSLVSQPKKWVSSFSVGDLKRTIGNSGLF